MKDDFDNLTVYDLSDELEVNKKYNNHALENKIDEMKCISYCFTQEEWDDIEEELLEYY